MLLDQKQELDKAFSLIQPHTQWAGNLARLTQVKITIKGGFSLFSNSCTTWSKNWLALANTFFTRDFDATPFRASILIHESIHLFQRDRLNDLGFYWKYMNDQGRYDLEFEAEIEQIKAMKILGIWNPQNSTHLITDFLNSHSLSMNHFPDALNRIKALP